MKGEQHYMQQEHTGLHIEAFGSFCLVFSQHEYANDASTRLRLLTSKYTRMVL